MKNVAQTIAAFKIGRGGRFYNGGHKTFYGFKNINEFTDNLFLTVEDESDLEYEIGDRINLLEKFQECREDLDFDFFAKLKLTTGKLVWIDHNRSEVGLDYINDGTGTIDLDGIYDTTICKRLEDCDENELQMILDANLYMDYGVEELIKEKLGY